MAFPHLVSRFSVAALFLAVTPLSCGGTAADSNPDDDASGSASGPGAEDDGGPVEVDAATADADVRPVDATVDAADAQTPLAACPPGTTDRSLTLGASVAYTATHLTNNPAHTPFAAICLPITAAGQSFYLESNVIRSGCNVYDACEASLEIKCFDPAGTQLRPQLWSGENFPNGAPTSSLVARLMFTSTSVGPVTCKALFFNHDHGIVGGRITVVAGSTFSASGPFSGAAATSDSGGGGHLSSANPTAALKPLAGWHMPAGMNRVDYIGDIQATECHAVYPSNANDPATQCTTAESGSDSTVEYRAQAVEEYANGTTCHVTDGLTTTKSITTQTHHKMLYTQVLAPHTAGCANVWHFQVDTHWKSGRSFMVQSGPYGQGMVRALL